MIEGYRRKFAENQDRFHSEWKEFLSFPSVSADSSFADGCEACCKWLSEHVRSLGFTVEILRGNGNEKPILLAERAGDS